MKSFGLILLSLASIAQTTCLAQQIKVPLEPTRWTILAGNVEFIDHFGVPSIDLKAGNYAKKIASGEAVLKDLSFATGTIEYDVDANAGMGAGFGFRRTDKDTFEDFYLRPQPDCDHAPDCIQYAPETHGVLLWDLFPQYQAHAPLQLGRWNHIKLVISAQRMDVFVNGSGTPSLKVGRLEGDAQEGSLMLQGPGIFSNLSVTPGRSEHLPDSAAKDPGASDRRFLRNWQVSAPSGLAADQVPAISELPVPDASWSRLDAERNGLINVSRRYGLPYSHSQRALVWLKTSIESSRPQQKQVSVGWAREVWVFVNGRPVFDSKNLYMPKEARKAPDGRCSLENGSLQLPLKAGKNEVAVALADNFYGWALMMRLDDSKGVHLP